MPVKDFFGSLFGFTVAKTPEEKEKQEIQTFVAPTNQDGAITVENAAAAYGVFLNLDGQAKDEFELISKYREMSLLPEVDWAVDDITNEAIVLDGDDPPVELDLSEIDLDDSVKEKVVKAFDKVCKQLNWHHEAYEIFRKWYVDGRLYYHVVLPEPLQQKQQIDGGTGTAKVKKQGILELRYIDPRQIRKVRVVDRQIDAKGVETMKVVEEYYIYNQRGIQYQGPSMITPQVSQSLQGLKISLDCVVYIHSGILDKFSSTILSNLHKAIKVVNQLKMMEDALVIYRISRAPERRIFYIDVGNLPKTKAEDYLRTIMARYRSKMLYDINTGEMRDDRRHLSMLEDFWVPRRDGSQSTQIDTLPGGENLGKMEDVEYFQKQVYKALNVPVTRLQPDAGFAVGRTTEITRDENKFSKFISRQRLRFSQLFVKLLEIELILTGVMSKEEWNEISYQISQAFKFAKDNYFTEIQENEMMKGRLETLSMMDPDALNYTRKYYSVAWIRKHILKQTEDEQKELDKQIKKEETKYADLLLGAEEGGMPGLPTDEPEPAKNFDDSFKSKHKKKPDKPS